MVMRRLCPNLEREDGLETVLEVPIPEDMFKSLGNNVEVRWQNMLTWMKAQNSGKWSSPLIAARFNDLRFLLFIVGSPLIPLRVHLDHSIRRPIRDCSIEASTAKYIVQQYIAATGGQAALNSVQSMCVTGQVKVGASDFHQGGDSVRARSSEETGGFVLWQKNPDLWCLELVISGCKVTSGSNGKLSWRQSSNQRNSISKGAPRPLRRFLQGLDPRSTAYLFLDAVCIGEKIINNEDCFILKLETSSATLEAQSGPNFEIIHHTIWGYFSQRSGLLVEFEDSRLLRMKTKGEDDVFWETSTESVIEDYRYVDGVNVAHSGKTTVTVFRYGEQSANHKREMEETWKIEEVDFNVWGLSSECFLPPSDPFCAAGGYRGKSSSIEMKRNGKKQDAERQAQKDTKQAVGQNRQGLAIQRTNSRLSHIPEEERYAVHQFTALFAQAKIGSNPTTFL
ncbi:uncharacterized protein LOC131155358 [Malania oleifera]|uniref:uncharacterized protein LOC131155358 n=1 Tax=Malania oleifera TaxID=397392 RepID=UPI0025AE164D|nr:uncharacterized protein LOC131155358 [Malania oleifera]